MRAKDFLTELNMSPSRLMQFAKSPAAENMLAGFEVEVIVPGYADDMDDEQELDWDQDSTLPRSVDFSDVAEFFQLSIYDTRSLRSMQDDYEDYQNEAYETYQEQNIGEFIDAIKNANPDMDDDDVQEKANDECSEDYWSYHSPELYAFFKSNDWHVWSDLHSEYNLDWPYLTQPNSQDSFEQYGNDLHRIIGQRVVAINDYHGGQRALGGREKDTWYLEPDASIDPDDGDQMGMEIISPPMSVFEMLDKLEKTLDWVRYNNGYTNDSTGLHVGVSMKGRANSQLDYVKLAIFLGDEYVLDQFRRLQNSYAKSSYDVIQSKILNAEGITAKLEGIKSGMIDVVSQTIMKRNSDKYVSINMHDDYVEFRSMGHDYLERFDVIKNTILRYIQAYAVAMDPQAERKEYIKKLSTLLNPTKMDMISPFVAYTAGQLNKEELIRMIKSFRTQKELINQQNTQSDPHGGTNDELDRLHGTTPVGQAHWPAGIRPPAHVTNRMTQGELNLADFDDEYGNLRDRSRNGEF